LQSTVWAWRVTWPQKMLQASEEGIFLQITPDIKKKRFLDAASVGRWLGLDFLLLTAPENIYYLSGFRTMLYTRFCGVLVKVADASATLLIPSVDKYLAFEGWWSPTWFGQESIVVYGPAEPVRTHFDLLRKLVPEDARVGVDSITYAFYESLRATMPGLQAIPVYDEINSLKLVKAAEEIAALRRANEIAVAGMRRVKNFLASVVGASREVTELDIASEIDTLARAEGCDGFGYPTLVSFGDKMRAPHSPPLRRVIPSNQGIRVAFGPTYDGYSADVIRTFVIGEPEPIVYRLRDAFVEAQSACLTALKPGVTSPELLEIVRGVYDRHDMTQYWGGSIGHGIGITIHEPPRVQQDDSTALPADAIVAIEPTVGNAGYAQCDVARVTPAGGEWLAPCELDLVVIR